MSTDLPLCGSPPTDPASPAHLPHKGGGLPQGIPSRPTADCRLPTPVSVVSMPVLDPSRRTTATLAEGASVAEIVGQMLPGANPAQVRVRIDGREVEPEVWVERRPAAGQVVVLRLVPAGDGLRTVLQIAVLIAAVALGGWLGPALAASAFGTALGLTAAGATSLITSGAFVAGSLLVNALIPPPRPSVSSSRSVYGVQGWRNVENPDGVIPAVMGRHRMAPPLSASTYTEIVGDQQYIRGRFLFGYGELEITDIRIGETPIEEFKDLQMEVRYGVPGQDPITLYRRTVIEEQLSLELLGPDIEGDPQPEKRLSAPDAYEISIDWTYPRGLYHAPPPDHEAEPWEVSYVVTGRLAGTDPEDAIEIDEVTHRAAEEQMVRRTLEWTPPQRGKWEIEIERTTPNHHISTRASQSVWTALRSRKPEPPVNVPGLDLAEIAIRVRASRQLNGAIDTLNALVRRVCLDWDAETGTWIKRGTSNPASLFRWAAQGPACSRPRPNAKIHLEELADWHEFCVAKGLIYERIHDFEGSFWETLRAIAAAGRARPVERAGKLSVIIDRPASRIISTVTPRNSRNFAWERTYFTRPDGFRVTFPNRDDDYRPATRTIPWPGTTGPGNGRFEELDLPGVTDPAQVYRAASRRAYELEYRADQFTATQDVAGLELQPGDTAELSHSDLDRAQTEATVRAVAGALVELDVPVAMVDGEDYALRFIRADDETGDVTRWTRTITAEPGETRFVHLTGAGAEPSKGDRALFGRLTTLVEDVVVRGLTGGEGLSATLAMIPAAPIIDALVDALVVPVFDGRYGDPVIASAGTPDAPRIDDARTGGDDETTIFITLRPRSGSAPVGSWEVRHRPISGGAWTSVIRPAGLGTLTIEGYDIGDEVEYEARGYGLDGDPGGWSPTRTISIASRLPAVDGFTATRRDDGLWDLEWSFPDADSDAFEDLVGARIRSRPGNFPDSEWDDLEPIHGGMLTASPYLGKKPVEAGAHTFGIRGYDAGGKAGAVLVIVASAAPLSPPEAFDADESGGVVTLTARQPNVKSSTSIYLWKTPVGATFDPDTATLVAGPIWRGPGQTGTATDTTGTSRDYWATSHNAAGDASDPAGPLTITI